jgi:hypothetical protein
MLLVKEPFRKKGAIPWEAIRECLNLREDQTVGESNDVEAGESGGMQEGREAQHGGMHSVDKVEMVSTKRNAEETVTVREKRKAPDDTQRDEPAAETDLRQQKPKKSKVLKPKLEKKKGKTFKSREIISDSEEGTREEGEEPGAGTVQVKEELMDVVMVRQISFSGRHSRSPGRAGSSPPKQSPGSTCTCSTCHTTDASPLTRSARVLSRC